ncbi:MAG: aminodeoxychorismate/anthranilate synthase component II [Succinivibrio sp.]|nr:aminodeoxychorismate/anthranilate synthase component II [Succinivibrio sp.]
MASTVIFIDNFDSFSYNLVDELKVLGNRVLVYRNDVAVDLLEQVAGKCASQGEDVAFVLSPGPSTPAEAHNLLPLVRKLLGRYPMLGICLGHQALGEVLGGHITQAPEIVHGKSSDIIHHGTGPFATLPCPLKVARYHSLIVTDLPSEVEVLAEYEGICMSLYDKDRRVLGYQFHPESIMTAYGRRLLGAGLRCLFSAQNDD